MTEIFVFGSNLAGRHGKGAALFARKHYGAVYGEGVGRTGNAYAIPTKDQNIKTLGLRSIEVGANNFIQYANGHPELSFKLTEIGCGLAGYSDDQIAPMFKEVPNNVIVSDRWKKYI